MEISRIDNDDKDSEGYQYLIKDAFHLQQTELWRRIPDYLRDFLDQELIALGFSNIDIDYEEDFQLSYNEETEVSIIDQLLNKLFK